MIKIFSIIFILLSSTTVFAAENYSNDSILSELPPEFKDLSGKQINNFPKETPAAFVPKKPTPSRFFAADL